MGWSCSEVPRFVSAVEGVVARHTAAPSHPATCGVEQLYKGTSQRGEVTVHFEVKQPAHQRSTMKLLSALLLILGALLAALTVQVDAGYHKDCLKPLKEKCGDAKLRNDCDVEGLCAKKGW